MPEPVLVKLPRPHKYLTPNVRANRYAKNRVFQESKDMATLVCKQAMQAVHCLGWQSARYDVHEWTPTAKRQDQDNLVASLKAYLDGCVLAGLVPDDRFLEIGDVDQSISPRMNDQHRLQITFHVIEE